MSMIIKIMSMKFTAMCLHQEVVYITLNTLIGLPFLIGLPSVMKSGVSHKQKAISPARYLFTSIMLLLWKMTPGGQ
ncbi:MAG: hypothetical protein BM485_11215 [Desulfobulbaceae bacterium DB1]|nr:MAG: hypothetical protein BM485_11215 [Desulfobulbaceae bacterium DB1]